METAYLHAASRAKALTTKLLSDVQLERLLSAKDITEAFKALQDTFLAPYLGEHEKTDINRALDESMLEAKKVLASVTPDRTILEILWIKYDFYNLKAIIKGKRAGFEDEEILSKCSKTGIYPPEKLLKHYTEERLETLNSFLAVAAKKAGAAKEVFEMDIAINIAYFEAIRDYAKRYKKNIFIQKYTRLLIDFFNLEAALRMHTTKRPYTKGVFVEGGTIPYEYLGAPKKIFEEYKRFGGEKLWSEPIKAFEKTGDFSLLERTAEEFVLAFLKEESVSITSPAPLFAYFAAKKNNAQTIRAIMVAKQTGLPERDLRIILRRLYS